MGHGDGADRSHPQEHTGPQLSRRGATWKFHGKDGESHGIPFPRPRKASRWAELVGFMEDVAFLSKLGECRGGVPGEGYPRGGHRAALQHEPQQQRADGSQWRFVEQAATEGLGEALIRSLL